jgi:hypothetical protein
MQLAGLDVFDVRQKPAAIREEYGAGTFATGCLLVRRLVERGVRYVHVGFGGWRRAAARTAPRWTGEVVNDILAGVSRAMLAQWKRIAAGAPAG